VRTRGPWGEARFYRRISSTTYIIIFTCDNLPSGIYAQSLILPLTKIMTGCRGRRRNKGENTKKDTYVV
jgi:hypothetical protein